MNNKSRDQSLYSYLECLQLEYITCELRKKVYFKKKDKSFYQRTMDRKREKIKDISERNLLQTIFSDDSVRVELYAKIYKDHGFPDFAYNNELDIIEFAQKDKDYYYSEGAEVRVLMEDQRIEIGIITDRYFEKNLIHIKLRGDDLTKPYPITRVTRIL